MGPVQSIKAQSKRDGNGHTSIRRLADSIDEREYRSVILSVIRSFSSPSTPFLCFSFPAPFVHTSSIHQDRSVAAPLSCPLSAHLSHFSSPSTPFLCFSFPAPFVHTSSIHQDRTVATEHCLTHILRFDFGHAPYITIQRGQYYSCGSWPG